MSNRDAANLFRETNPDRLKTLLLAHISEECNKHHLALEEMSMALSEHNRSDIHLTALYQDEPSNVFEF